jgi:hypothetical protein
MKRIALKTLFTTLLCVGALASPALAQLNGGFELCMGQSPQHYEGNRDQRGADRPGHHWQEGRWERQGQNNHDGPDRWTPGRWEPDHKDNMMDRRDDNRRNDSHMDNNRREDPRKDSNQRDSQGDERKTDSRRGNDRG